MSRRVRLLGCVLGLLLATDGLGRSRPALAQAPSVNEAVVAALSADTESARRALLDAHPELIVEPGFTALRTAATLEARQTDPTRAYNGLRTLIDAAARAGDRGKRRQALKDLGTLAGQKGHFVIAEPALTEALASAEADHDVELFIVAANNLGIVYRLQGRFNESMASYRRGYAAAEAAGRRDSVARSLNNMGIVAEQQGDRREALSLLTRSLAIKETLGDEADIARTNTNIGIIHYSQGNLEQALTRFERSRDIGTRTGNRRVRAAALVDVGNIYALTGRFAEASATLNDALAGALELGDNMLLGTTWHTRGVAAGREHQWSTARAAFATALDIRERAGGKPGSADTLLELARLELAAGTPAAAVPISERCVALARSIGLAPTLWDALRVLGSAHAALGHEAQAIAAFEESIAQVERVRLRVAGGAEDLRRFFEDKSAAYYELASLHAARGRAEAAFALVERARARVLLDLIESGKPPSGALSPRDEARETVLTRELVDLGARRDAAAREGAADPGEIHRLDDALDRARRAREEWLFEAYGASPDLAFTQRSSTPVTLATAMTGLPAGAVVVTFMVGTEQTRLLTLTRTAGGAPRVQVLTLGVSRAELTSRAERFRASVGSRDLGFAAEARALYDLLLGPAEPVLTPGAPLVIVADGPLWNIPFQALLSSRQRYLLEERPVSYAPSVSALHGLRQRRTSRAAAPRHLVAIGDPATTSGAARLPEAAREVKALAAMYGAGSEVLTGEGATEAALRQRAPSASVLHIATHGELVRSAPMYSFVMLGGERTGADLSRDGHLEAWELANLRLQADVAVLSACESARGGDGGGEGVMGLSWSLFAAGASTAVVSLWRVDSTSTTRLMLGFHRALLQPGRMRSAAAMRQAARALMATPRFRHPFYWAGFVVVGEP